MIAWLLPIAKKNWLQLSMAGIIVAMGGYIYVQGIQKKNIILSFDNYKLAAAEVVKARETEIAVKETQSLAAKQEREKEYAQKLAETQAKIREYEARNGNLASDNKRLADAYTGLRYSAESTRRALSSMVETAGASAESGGDCNQRIDKANGYIEVLTMACKQTTLDYDALRTWAEDEGRIKGWR